MDEKSIENGLEGQKFLVVCLFWGGCHHPNHNQNSKAPVLKNKPHISPTACAPAEQTVEGRVVIEVEVRVVVSRFLVLINSVTEPALASWTSLVFRSVNTAGGGIYQNITYS